MVSRLQLKASQIGNILKTLESHNKSHAAESDKQHKKTASQGQGSKMKLDGPPQKKPHYIDPIPPFNASKIRKSPSMSSTITANATPSTPLASTAEKEPSTPTQ